MTMLVSVEDAIARLRIDSDAADTGMIEAIIKGASAAILNYVRSADPDWLDTAGDPTEDTNGVAVDVPDDVVTAAIMLTGILFRDPDGKDIAGWDHGFLPRNVLCLLTPYRLPTLS